MSLSTRGWRRFASTAIVAGVVTGVVAAGSVGAQTPAAIGPKVGVGAPGKPGAQAPLAVAAKTGVAPVNKHMGIGLVGKPLNPPKPKTAIAFDCAKPNAEMCRQPAYYAKCPDQRKEKSFCFDTITKLGEAQYKAAEAKGDVRTILFPGATVAGDKIPGAVVRVDHTKDTFTGGLHSYTSLVMRPISAPFAPLAAVQQAYKVKKQAKEISSCEDYVHQKYFSFDEFESAVQEAGGSARAFFDLATSPKWEVVAKGKVISLDGKPAASRKGINTENGLTKEQYGWSATEWKDDMGAPLPGPNGFREYPPPIVVAGTANTRFDYPLIDATYQAIEFPGILSLAAAMGKTPDLAWDKQKALNATLSKQYLEEELATRFQKAMEYRSLAEERDRLWWQWNANVNMCVDADKPLPEFDYESKTLLADMETARNAAVKKCVNWRNQSVKFKSAGNAANVAACEKKTLPALKWKINHAKASAEGMDKVRAQLKSEWKKESEAQAATWAEYDKKRTADCKAIGFEGLIHHYDAAHHYKNIRNLPALSPEKVKWVRDTVSNGYNFPKVRKVLEGVHKKLRAIDSQLLELQTQGQALGCYNTSATTNACNWSPQFFVEYFKHVRHWLYVERDRDLKQCGAFTNNSAAKGAWFGLTWKKSAADTLGGNDVERAAKWKKTLANITSFEKYLEAAEDYVREFKEESKKYAHHLQATDANGKKALGNAWNDTWSGGNEYFGGSYDIGASWRVAGVDNSDKQCDTNAKVEAHLKAKATVFKKGYPIVDVDLWAETRDQSAAYNAHAKVIGTDLGLHDLFGPYGGTVTLAHSFALNKTFDDAFDYSGSADFPVGPILISVGGGVSGNFGINLNFTPSVKRQCAANSPPISGNPELSMTARVEPYAQLNAHAEVGVDFWIGEVGIRGSLVLVKLGLPLDVEAGFKYRDEASLKQLLAQNYNVNPKLPGFYVNAKAELGLDIETLAGSVDLYLKLGWGWLSKSWDWNIVSWQGYGYETTLFEADLAAKTSALFSAVGDANKN